MENWELLDIARRNYKEGNYEIAKKHFDLYLNEIYENLGLSNLGYFIVVSDDYIDLICKSIPLNISETNPIYKDLDEGKLLSYKKIANREALSEHEDNIQKLEEYSILGDVLWGNYSGLEISEIIKKDPEYILWCIINLEHFAIDNVAFVLPNIRNEPTYITALEINMIKQLIIEKYKPHNDEGKDDNNLTIDDEQRRSHLVYDSDNPEAFWEAWEEDENGTWDDFKEE